MTYIQVLGDIKALSLYLNDSLDIVSDNAFDTGLIVSSGIADGGTDKKIHCIGKLFTSDVLPGDILVNDTLGIYGFVTIVASDSLTVDRMIGDIEGKYKNELGNSFRVITANSSGASVVKLSRLLDQDFNQQVDAFVVLNGLTPVTTINSNYIRNSMAEVIKSASSTANVGNISCLHGTDQMWQIQPQRAKTAICADTVPNGYWLHLIDLQAYLTRVTGQAASCTMVFESKYYGSNYQTDIYAVINNNYGYHPAEQQKIYLPPKSQFRWRCLDTSSANSSIRASCYGHYTKDSF